MVVSAWLVWSGMAQAAIPADLVVHRWQIVEVSDAGQVVADGDRPWRMRCPDGRPSRQAHVGAAQLSGPFSEADGVGDPDGAAGPWATFAPGPAVELWTVPVGCRVQVAMAQRTSRAFDHMEHQSPPVVWSSRAKSAFGSTASGWLEEGGLDAYRALRPPVLRGMGTHPDRDGTVRGPARVRVVAHGSGPSCVVVDALQSCRMADPDARWWLTLPSGRHRIQVTGAVEAEMAWSVLTAPAAPAEATMWPACATPRDCAPGWEAQEPLGVPATAHHLEPARGTEATAWWPAGHPTLPESTWLDRGSLHLLTVPGPTPCVLHLGDQTLHAHTVGPAPVRSRLVWTGQQRPEVPRVEGCSAWVRAVSEGDAWDASVLRRYSEASVDRPLQFAPDPRRPAVAWVLAGEDPVELQLGDQTWELTPGPLVDRVLEGSAVADPVRVPIPAGSRLEVRTTGVAWARVLQPALGPTAPAPQSAPELSEAERVSRIDRQALIEATEAVATAPDAMTRATALRQRASMAQAVGLADDAAADRRWAAWVQDDVPTPSTDRWPAVAQLLEGPDRWVAVDGRWLSAPHPPERADDPLAAADLALPAPERLRLWLKAALDRQIPTAAQRLAAYTALATLSPEARSSPLLAPVRAWTRFEPVAALPGLRSELRPLPRAPERLTALAWQDTLFPHRWDPERTLSLSPGRVLRLPEGPRWMLQVRCRARHPDHPCAVHITVGGHTTVAEQGPLGRTELLSLAPSSEPRYIRVEPQRGRVAQVQVPEGTGAALVAPEARWWWVQGTESVTLVAPTVLRVRAQGEVTVAGRPATDGDEIELPGSGPVEVPLTSADGAWLRLAIRVAEPTALPVSPQPTSPLLSPPGAADATLTRGGWARPVGRPPVSLELELLGGARDHALLSEGGSQLDLALGLRSRPLSSARWWNRVAVDHGQGPAGAVTALRAQTVLAPLWGPRRLVFGLTAQGAQGGSEAGVLQTGAGTGWVRFGLWPDRRLLLSALAATTLRGASGPAAGADPHLWSPFAADHPLQSRAEVAVRWVPSRWADAELEGHARSNSPGSRWLVDAVGASLRADFAAPRVWSRLAVGWDRWLADLDRDEQVETVSVAGSAWLSGWIRGHAGVRWGVHADARVLGPQRWTVSTGPTVLLSRDRGLTDLPPTALAHRDAAAWTWDDSARRAWRSP